MAEVTTREIYRPLTDAGAPLIVTDAVTAELVKGAANAFLAAKVSFINAVPDICAATGADVATLADALGMDARIGRAFLTAGLGYGGGCLPKDVRGLCAFAAGTGARGASAVRLLTVLDEINSARRQQVVGLAQTLLASCPASESRCGARRSRTSATRTARRRPRARRTPCSWSLPGRSSRRSIRPRLLPRSATACSSTRARPSTRRGGGQRAGRLPPPSRRRPRRGPMGHRPPSYVDDVPSSTFVRGAACGHGMAFRRRR
jgi:UDP-glucose/GDP-mannose dehydrogenase family, central domain